jgi:hypothetical protein
MDKLKKKSGYDCAVGPGILEVFKNVPFYGH